MIAHLPPGENSPRSERGTALIEMAAVVGLLTILLFGIITYGVTMSYKQTMAQATNEAARAAAVAPADLAVARATAAADRATSGERTPCNTGKGLTCTFTIDPCVGTPGRCMTVTLTYDLKGHPRVPTVPGVRETLPDKLVSTAVVEVAG